MSTIATDPQSAVRPTTFRPTFERVVGHTGRNPDRPCLHEGGRSITFARLLEDTDAARHRLARLGVGPGDLVAVSCTSRAAAIAGMLASWSQGAAYLALAPGLPRARTQAILDLARPAALLTDAAASPSAAGPARRLDPSAAYVVFTSGSTGRPKGVVVGHAGLAALTDWHRDVTGLAPGDCASHVADLGFDASVWEIWAALANGAALAVPTFDELLDPAELQRFLLTHEVRAGFVPTGLVPGLLDLDWSAEVPLRVLFTGGDRLIRWPEPRHPFRLVNAYGPTECTVVATAHTLEPSATLTMAGAPPIGQPLPHVRARVVGPEGTAVAPGVTGELWLAGPALALGYLDTDNNDDGEADEAFVTRDLGGGPTRWYRTGDLVTEDACGVLHYVARGDDQVQIDGRRTEPAEIARAVLGVPGVTNAVVFTRTTPSGAGRLVAAVSPVGVTRQEVQQHLLERLPMYMIPSEVLAMDALPLTDRGKFDLASLADLARTAEGGS
jgi:amino acid adenylation domain-containing protein